MVASELEMAGNWMTGLRCHVKQFGVQSVGRAGCVRALKQGDGLGRVRTGRLGFARSSERAGRATLRKDHDARY